jgi:hypothetical protein
MKAKDGESPTVLSAEEKEQAKMVFLSAFNILLSKYGLIWSDVNINFEAGVIDVQADLDSLVLLRFIEDLEKITGKLK